MSKLKAQSYNPLKPQPLATIPSKEQQLIDSIFSKASDQIDRLERSYYAVNFLLEGVVFTDLKANILWANQSMEQMTGYSLDELQGKPINIIKSDFHDQRFYQSLWDSLLSKHVWEGEVWNRRKNGERYLQYSRIYTIYDDQNEPIEYLLVCLDLTDKNDLLEKLNVNMNFDQLTGLPNKYYLKTQLEKIIRLSKKNNTIYYVAIDIDRFSYINHTFSYVIGDMLLLEIANRLSNHVNQGEVYRFSSDMFVLLLKGFVDDKACLNYLKALNNLLSTTYQIAGVTLSVSCSFGVTKIPQDGKDFDVITKHAESALRESKQSDFKEIIFFNPLIEEKFTKRFLLGNALQHAIAHEELEVYYQIQVKNHGVYQIVGAEALVRWNHPKFGLIVPDEFIPYAEMSGLIVPLGYWVFNQICQLIHRFKDSKHQSLRFSVNISAKQLSDPMLVSSLTAICEQHDVSPSHIELEVTESNTIKASTSLFKLQQLRNAGFSIAIDDFGTGYSSLSYLTSLPIDKVKIDRSFISHITQDKTRQKIVLGMIALAKSIDLTVIAEGVETIEDANFLIEKQCDLLQGYYFSKPVPLSHLLTLLP